VGSVESTFVPCYSPQRSYIDVYMRLYNCMSVVRVLVQKLLSISTNLQNSQIRLQITKTDVGGSLNLVDKLSTPDVTPCSTPAVTPVCSPQVNITTNESDILRHRLLE